MSKTTIPTDGKAFAVFVGAKPKSVGWYAQRKFLERIGVRPKPPTVDGKKFAESVRRK